MNLPHSTRMEQEVLCLLFQQSPRVPEAAKHFCAQRLTGGDFYHDPHRLVFEAAVTRLLRDGKVYLPLVVEDLSKLPGWESGVLEKWAREAYLAGQTFPTGDVNIAAFCEQLRAYAQARRAMEIGARLVRMCETEAAANAAGFAAETARKLADVAASKLDVAEEHPDAIAARLIRELDGGVQRSRVATRLPELDSLLSGGYEDGTLNVIAARRGVGKSAVALHLALTAAGAGRPVLFVSLEMSHEQMVGRALGMISGVPMRNRGLPLNDEERAALADARARLNRLPVIFSCRPGTMAEIESRMASHYARGEMSVVVIDYLQKLTPHRAESSQRWLSECVGAFKNVAGQYSVPVILLAQVRREGEYSPKVPTMSCLKGSGSIEEDADSVLLMWPPNKPNTLACNLEKNRHGATGGFDLYADWRRMRVRSMEWKEGDEDGYGRNSNERSGNGACGGDEVPVGDAGRALSGAADAERVYVPDRVVPDRHAAEDAPVDDASELQGVVHAQTYPGDDRDAGDPPGLEPASCAVTARDADGLLPGEAAALAREEGRATLAPPDERDEDPELIPF